MSLQDINESLEYQPTEEDQEAYVETKTSRKISTREVLRHQDIEDSYFIEQYRTKSQQLTPSETDLYLARRRVEDLRQWHAAEPWSYEIGLDLAEAKKQLALLENTPK